MTDDNENVVADPYLDKYYRMDPETEDLVFDGTELRDGMVVTYAEPEYRQTLYRDPKPEVLHMILERNRWFTVSKVYCKSPTLRFVATYADGHKQRMELSSGLSFYVKKDSIPVVEAPEALVQMTVIGTYQIMPRVDGTISVFIIEDNGAATEFIVTPGNSSKPQPAFKELVDMDQSPVNPRAPFFHEPMHADMKNIERHDPEWAIRNLTKYRDIAKEDPTATRTDIPVFTGKIHDRCPEYAMDILDAGTTIRCVLNQVPEHIVHENGRGMFWRVVNNMQINVTPESAKKYQIVDVEGSMPPKDPQWMIDGADDQPQD